MSSMAAKLPLFSLPLRYFVAVARTRSVSEAARQLHVAASAVSRQVSLLEEGLGMPLFERAPRGMLPTPAGERLLAHLIAATEEGASLVEQLRGLAGRPRVRLACTEGFAVGFVADAVRDLREAYPGIQFELAVVAPGQVNQMLRQGDADLGLKYSLGPERDARLLHGMTAPVMAVLRPGHPLARRTALTVADAVNYPLVLGPAGTTSRSLFDLACSQQGVQYVPALESNFSSALLSMLGERDILPAGYLTVAHAVAAGTLRAIPFTEPELQQRRMCLLAQNGRSLLPPVQALADLLVACMTRYGKRKVRAVKPAAAVPR